MKRQNFYPTSAPAQIIWLENYRSKIATYAATLSLTPAEVAATVADARWIAYILVSWLPAVRTYTKACTDAAAQAQSPVGSSLMALPVFTAPTLPNGVAPVNVGALDRIFALGQTLKTATGFTTLIGADLGVTGNVQNAPDMLTIQPVIDATVTATGVQIGWGWGGNGAFLDMVELEVDRGAGFVFLANDTTPGYTDTTPFPAALAKWTYRAIYRVGDAQVGVWSNVVSVTVGG